MSFTCCQNTYKSERGLKQHQRIAKCQEVAQQQTIAIQQQVAEVQIEQIITTTQQVDMQFSQEISQIKMSQTLQDISEITSILDNNESNNSKEFFDIVSGIDNSQDSSKSTNCTNSCFDKLCMHCQGLYQQMFSQSINSEIDAKQYKFQDKPTNHNSAIIDISRNKTSIKVLYQNGQSNMIQNSKLLIDYYNQEHTFADKLQQKPIRLSVYEYMQEVAFNETKQNVRSHAAMFNKINVESGLDIYKTDFNMAYFDIETVCYHDKRHTPQPENKCDEIVTIQFINNNQKYIYINQRLEHTYDKQQLKDVCIKQFQNEHLLISAFVKFIREQKLTIWVGFNASSENVFGSIDQLKISESTQIYGYDCNWIFGRRCKYIFTPYNKSISVNNKSYLQTLIFSELPNAYFVDARRIFQGGLTQKALRQMRKYGLKNYCEMYGLGNKQENSYYQMNQCFRSFKSDITQYLQYGIQDCVVLQQITEKLQYKESLQAQMQLQQLGLYAIISQTDAKNLQVLINREVIRQGLAPSYKSQNKDEKGKYPGALTGVDSEIACKLQKNVLQNDFCSLYPSCIREFNISIDTLTYDLDEPDIIVIDLLGYQDESKDIKIMDDFITLKQQKVGFRQKQQGLYTQIVSSFMDQRNKYKQLEADSKKQGDYIMEAIYKNKQLTCKKIANSFYGANGDKTSPQFKLEIAMAITAQARLALTTLQQITRQMNLPILAWDTDAVNNKIDHDLTWDYSNKLTSDINKELIQIFPNGNLLVACEELMTRVIFARSKKSYARIELNQKMVQSITVKGITWSNINPGFHERVLKECENILNEVETVKSIQDKFTNELNQAIKNKDLEQLEQWAMIKKSCGKSDIHKMLRIKYPEIVDDNYILFKRKPSYVGQKIQDLILPIQELQKNKDLIQHIDAPQTIQTIINQFHKLFTLDKQGSLKSDLLDFDPFNVDKIFIRIEKPKKELLYIDIDQIEDFVAQNGDKWSFHEMLNHKTIKLFFDIDELNNKIVDPVSHINRILTNMGFQNLQIYFATAHSKNKQSFHLVTNLQMTKQMCLKIGQLINEISEFDLIDLQPYKSDIRSLRLPNCVKFSKDQIEDRKFVIQNGTFKDMIIGNLENTIRVQCSSIFEPDYQVIDIDHVDDFVVNGDLAVIDQTLQRYKAKRGQKLRENVYKVITETGNCILNPERHGHNPSIWQYNNKLVIKCFGMCNDQIITLNNEKPIKQYIIPQPEQFQITQSGSEFIIDQLRRLMVIKADVSRGKTHQIIKLLKMNPNMTSVFITQRMALAHDLSNRLGQNGIEAINYKKIKGSIYLQIDKPTIVQFESLDRINDGQVDILILDEWLSILEEINAKLSKTHDRLLQKLYQLVVNSKYCIVMDAGLSMRSAAIISDWISQEPHFISDGVHPYNDYQVTINNCQIKHFELFVNQIIDALNRGENVVSFISIKDWIYSLIKILLDKGIIERQEMVYIIGDDKSDYRLDENNELKVRDIKEPLLQDFSQVRKFRLLMFNTAITSGVDFSEEHYHQGIHMINYNCTSTNQLCQALFRVRKLYNKQHTIYALSNSRNIPFKPCQLADIREYFNPVQQIKKVAESFCNQQAIDPLQSTMQWLANRHIKIQFNDMRNQKVQDFKLDIQLEQLPINEADGKNIYLSKLEEPLEQIITYCEFTNKHQQTKYFEDGNLNHIRDCNVKIDDYYKYRSFTNIMEELNDKIQLTVKPEELSRYQLQKLIDQLYATSRLFSHSQQPFTMTEQQLGRIHSKQIAYSYNAFNLGLDTKITIEQQKEFHRQEMKLIQYKSKYITIKTNITTEQIQQIKELTRKASMSKKQKQLILDELQLQDLKVDTVSQNLEVLYNYFKNTGKIE